MSAEIPTLQTVKDLVRDAHFQRIGCQLSRLDIRHLDRKPDEAIVGLRHGHGLAEGHRVVEGILHVREGETLRIWRVIDLNRNVIDCLQIEFQQEGCKALLNVGNDEARPGRNDRVCCRFSANCADDD